MLTCTNDLDATAKVRQDWFELKPLIQSLINCDSSVTSYLSLMNFKLLEHRMLGRFPFLPSQKQLELCWLFTQLREDLQTSWATPEALAQSLEKMNLLFDATFS